MSDLLFYLIGSYLTLVILTISTYFGLPPKLIWLVIWFIVYSIGYFLYDKYKKEVLE